MNLPVISFYIEWTRKDKEMGNTLEKLRIGVLLFIATFFVLLLKNANSFRDIPNDNLSYPALLIDDKGESGSGFFYNKEDAMYFVTARHVLFKGTPIEVKGIPKFLSHKIEWRDKKAVFHGVMSDREKDEWIQLQPKDKDVIEKLYLESKNQKLRATTATLFSYLYKIRETEMNEVQVELTKLYEQGMIKYHPSKDVTIIKIGTHEKIGNKISTKPLEGVLVKNWGGGVGLGENNFKLFDDVLIGNSIFVFGYPTSITNQNPFLDTKLPLLRKGVVAGKNNSLKAIILDCPMFHGNSGGLVLEVERTPESKELFRAIGLITNLVPFRTEEWVQNSGYSIAVPMDFVEELIEGQIK